MLFSPGRASWVSLLALTGITAAAADVGTQTNAGRGPSVLELYTSEGCSSCPPADRLLGELANKPNVIALAFHVDYWDNLGWRDPFEIPSAGRRAEGYVRALGLSSAFTPQAVVDGRISLVGSDQRRILQAMADATGNTVPVKLEVSEGNLIVTVAEHPGHDVHTVFVAAYTPHASTQVRRGENAGATLEEFNIVRDFRSLGNWNGAVTVFKVPLDSFPAEASRVAVLVQRSAQGPIAGSAVISLR